MKKCFARLKKAIASKRTRGVFAAIVKFAKNTTSILKNFVCGTGVLITDMHKKTSPQDFESILQAYYTALEESQKTNDYGKKVRAYNSVIGYCSNDTSCLNDNSRKRDMILYWTYNNLGDIFMEKARVQNAKGAYADAAESYQRALNFSRNSEEKIATMQKMSRLYSESGDFENFYNVQDVLIETYPPEDKREAYERLADNGTTLGKKIYFFEKALDSIKAEKTSALDRCHQTIILCEKLSPLYAWQKDYANLARIEELKQNTKTLIHLN